MFRAVSVLCRRPLTPWVTLAPVDPAAASTEQQHCSLYGKWRFAQSPGPVAGLSTETRAEQRQVNGLTVPPVVPSLVSQGPCATSWATERRWRECLERRGGRRVPVPGA